MTPNGIEILLHCHTSPQAHPRANAPAVQEALRSLLVNGLIRSEDGGYYSTTERGMAHVEQLCRLPWPVSEWVGADGVIIKTMV